jgi:hypothetical protein
MNSMKSLNPVMDVSSSTTTALMLRSLLTFLVIITAVLRPGICLAQIDSIRVLNDIRFLADDRNKGRAAGTAGERDAASFIVAEFRKLKLKPYGDKGTYEQRFAFNKGAHGEGERAEGANVVAYLDNHASLRSSLVPTTTILARMARAVLSIQIRLRKFTMVLTIMHRVLPVCWSSPGTSPTII